MAPQRMALPTLALAGGQTTSAATLGLPLTPPQSRSGALASASGPPRSTLPVTPAPAEEPAATGQLLLVAPPAPPAESRISAAPQRPILTPLPIRAAPAITPLRPTPLVADTTPGGQIQPGGPDVENQPTPPRRGPAPTLNSDSQSHVLALQDDYRSQSKQNMNATLQARWRDTKSENQQSYTPSALNNN